MVQGLFGGGEAGDAKKAQAEDFINRYQTGRPDEGYSDEEAVQAFEEVAKVASPEQMQQAFKQSVANLPEDERAQFNQMLQERQAGTGMIDIERSGDRKEVASRDSSGGSDSMGLDDLLGGLLGGATGGAAGSSGGGGLGDILGGLLGGASGGSGTAGAASSTQGGGGGIGDLLGGLLSSPAGKAVLAGTAAFAMKEVLGKK